MLQGQEQRFNDMARMGEETSALMMESNMGLRKDRELLVPLIGKVGQISQGADRAKQTIKSMERTEFVRRALLWAIMVLLGLLDFLMLIGKIVN